MQRINKLDGLRGLFALFVVLFHLNKNNAPQFIVANFFVRESYIFVDFFFILSGYVISLSYDQCLHNRLDFIHFIKKRFIRLYPLLLFTTIMYWFFVHPKFDNQNIVLALDTLLLTNSTPLISSGIGMNYPSWSISSEMISYIVFGLISMIALQKRKFNFVSLITIGCFILLAFQQTYFQTGSFGFIRGLACFNLGYFTYLLASKKMYVPNYIEWFILIFIVSLMFYHHSTLTHPILIRLLQFLIPITFAISILIFLKTNGLFSQFLNSKPFLFLGKISYSLYLNHAFIIGYFMPKIFKWIQFTSGEAKKTISMLVFLVLLIIYSWLTLYLIETKIGKKLSQIFK